MPKIWLPNSAAKAYFENRQQIGPDPFPEPTSEREEIVHQLWQLRVAVAGWWLEETSVLRDMLHKYLETQPQEAMRMEKEAAERARRRANGPTRQQISESLRDVREFQQARVEGRKRLY